MSLQGRLRSLLASVESGERSPFPGQEEGLRVYVRSRANRLIEILQDDFPRVRAALGEERFATVAKAYLSAIPPREAALRHLGDDFARYLAETEAPRLAVELAELELAWNDVFDAPNLPCLGRAKLAEFPPHAWPRLRFSFSGIQIVEASRRIDAFDPEAPAARLPNEAVRLLLHRRDFGVFLRPLEPDEASALTLARTGAPFAAIAAAVLDCSPQPEAAPSRTLEIITRWLDDGLVQSVALGKGAPTS